jgi:NADH-quinone oxidoreductase subunit N
MFWGSIGALYQENIKKFFAYSSLHQIGYIILSLSTGSSLGLLSALMYIFIYMFTGIAFFSLILLTTYYIKYSSKKCKLIYLNNLALINKIEPALAFIFILILFSLANLPPFTGFFVKLYIFKSIVNCTYSYIW